MLNTFFSLLSIFPNKFFYDKIIINNLFDYNIKKNKIIFKNKKYNSFKKKKYISNLDNFIKEQEKNRNNMTLKLKDKNENVNNECKSENKNNSKNYIKSDKSINVSAYEKMNNISKNIMIPSSIGLNLGKKNNLIYIGKNKLEIMKNTNNKDEENLKNMNFNLNILDYLCLGRCKNRKIQFDLFRKGILIFKQKLDIINIFNYILFCEKQSNEEINTLMIR